jgi:hypothetical protein
MMDVDRCSTVFWSAITAANGDSTVAGVLAGLLIAAAAALLVQSYQGADAHTIALFGSGVPALALSTYLFTVIAGLNYQQNYPVSPKHPISPDNPIGVPINYKQPVMELNNLCSQVWSEWILAIGLVFIGTAVLVCGLAWALASYADNLAVRLCARNTPIGIVEERRGFFIRLNAWLSSAIVTAATMLLISTNVIYLAAINQADLHGHLLGDTWYVLFVIYFVGVFFLGRSSYEIWQRTRAALRANKNACAAYANFDSRVTVNDEGESARGNATAKRLVEELAGIVWTVLAALLAGFMTSGEAFGQSRGITVNPTISIKIAGFYVIARVAYVLIAGAVKIAFAKKDCTSLDYDTVALADGDPERIRITYSDGALTTTAFGVVLLAIVGTCFVVGLTQGPFASPLRISIALLLGGLYPALILTALSSSVPAADDALSRHERDWTARVVRLLIRAPGDGMQAASPVPLAEHLEKEADKAEVSG